MSKNHPHLDLSIPLYLMTEARLHEVNHKIDEIASDVGHLNGVDCSICLSPIPSAGNVTTACNHSFCLSCFLKHVDTKNTCPLCRGEIRSPTEISRRHRDGGQWERLVYYVRMAASSGGSLNRTFYILTSSNSQENFELRAANQYQRFMEDRNIRAIAEVRRQEAQQRRQTRRSQDRGNGIIVGAKMRLNPNRDPGARRQLRLALDGQEDNKLATITKVMVVNIDVKFDDYDKVVRFRKDSPHYTLVA